MIHPDTELRLVNEHIGFGVFATRFIPRGTITWARDELDQAFTEGEVAAMAPAYRRILDKYCFVDAYGQHVLCWDHSRFFNHSCNANCLGAGYEFEIAVRDIAPGEELTDDYGTLNIREAFQCACGSPNCRRQVFPDDMERFAGDWDRLVEAVFHLIPTVPQPLWAFVREQDRIAEAVLNPLRLVSIRRNYVPLIFPPPGNIPPGTSATALAS
ncbi:MAG: SET domain-containing protein [Limisphaerales bacterium]